MLEIVRGRNWRVAHTFQDSEDPEDLTDLSIYTTIACQIREKVAVRNARGYFEYRVVATVTVEVDGSVLYLKLPISVVNKIQNGEYVIDVVGTTEDNYQEQLLDPEPIRVVGRWTNPSADPEVDPLPEPPVPPDLTIPDFSGEFEEALED